MPLNVKLFRGIFFEMILTKLSYLYIINELENIGVIRMENKHIYILLSHTGSVVSSLIRRYSQMEYSHISLGIDDELKTFYSFGRKNPSNPLIAGFVSESIKDGVYTRFNDATFALYKIRVSHKQYSRFLYELSHFEKNKQAFRYNFVGLFSAKAGYSLDRKNAYFCSQFAAKLIEAAGIHDFNKKHGLISPMDFLELNNLELINEGILKDFRAYQWDILTEQKSYRVFRLSRRIINKIKGT